MRGALLTGAAAMLVAAASASSLDAQTFVKRVDAYAAFDSVGRRLDHPFLGGLDHPRPQLVDIDGDGDLDLFVQEYTGAMMFFENVKGKYVWRADKWKDLDIGEWSRFVDADGDGDLDLFAEAPYSYIRLFRNTGSTTAPAYTLAADTLRDAQGTPIFNDRQNIPQIVDVDCDGKLDLLLGRASGMVTHYEALDPRSTEHGGIPRFAFVSDSFQHIQIIGQQFNGPGGQPPAQPNMPGTMHGANTMIVADLDGDGDPDILWGDFFEPGLLGLMNTGSCEHPQIGRDTIPFPPNAPIRTSGYNAPALGDVDGDGTRDLLVGVLGGAYDPDRTARGNLWFLRQTAPMRYELVTKELLSSIDAGSESSPALVDLDGDGDLDLVLGNKIEPGAGSSTLYVYENRGTAKAPAFYAAGRLPVAGQFHFVPAFGDLDGDGKPDLVLGGWRDAVQYWHNDGTAKAPKFTIADSAVVRLTRGSYATPALGDLDGDGDLDLMVGEASGELNYYRNEGTRTQPKFVLVSDTFDGIDIGRRSAPALADVDGDGDLDLVVGTEAGPTQVWRNVGSRTAPTFQRDTTLDVALPPLSAPAFGDLNGDGRVDMMAGGSGGGVVYYEQRGR